MIIEWGCGPAGSSLVVPRVDPQAVLASVPLRSDKFLTRFNVGEICVTDLKQLAEFCTEYDFCIWYILIHYCLRYNRRFSYHSFTRNTQKFCKGLLRTLKVNFCRRELSHMLNCQDCRNNRRYLSPFLPLSLTYDLFRLSFSNHDMPCGTRAEGDDYSREHLSELTSNPYEALTLLCFHRTILKRAAENPADPNWREQPETNRIWNAKAIEAILGANFK